MKKISLSLMAIAFIVNFSYAQNTFPTSGNVGIGTTSPAQPLTIPISANAQGISLGTYSSLSAGQFAFVGITGADGTFNGGSLTSGDNGAAGMAIVHTSGGYGNSAELAFVTHNNGLDSRERVRIDRIGNVGIGTTNPQQLLNINSGAAPTASQFRITSNNLGSLSALSYSPDNTSIGFDVDYAAGSWIARNSTVAWLYKSAGQLQIIGSAGNTVGGNAPQNQLLDINLSSGNVGIGTSNPDQKLTVKGSIHSQEVIVDMSVLPDYIFKPTYHLPTLTEVKTYIDQNHHLPEMPSAEQVEKDGLSLGDMNAKLLKKVEELTLYLIEKDKTITDQQRQLTSQKEQINLINQQLELITKKLK